MRKRETISAIRPDQRRRQVTGTLSGGDKKQKIALLPCITLAAREDRDDAWAQREIERLWGSGPGAVALTGASAAADSL